MSLGIYEKGFAKIYLPNGNEIPQEAINYIRVIENVNLFVPTIEFSFHDVHGFILDKEGISRLYLEFGNEGDNWFRTEVATLSMPEGGAFLTREQGLQLREFRAIPYYALILSNLAKQKSYGFLSASEVLQKVIDEDIGIHLLGDIYYNVEDSIDKRYYIRPGWHTGQFLWFLMKKAVSPRGVGGYLCWFDHRNWSMEGMSALTPLKVNFVTPSYLADRPVDFNMRVSQHPEDITNAMENEGFSNGDLIALDVHTGFQLSFSSGCYVRTAAWFDVEAEKYDSHKWSYDDLGLSTLGSLRYRKAYDPLASLCKLEGVDTFNTEYEIDCNKLCYLGSSTKTDAKADISREPHLAFFKRRAMVTIFGNLELKLGNKIKLKVPMSDGTVHWALEGEWIVTGITHQINFPALTYHMKVTLSRDEYLGDLEDIQ